VLTPTEVVKLPFVNSVELCQMVCKLSSTIFYDPMKWSILLFCMVKFIICTGYGHGNLACHGVLLSLREVILAVGADEHLIVFGDVNGHVGLLDLA